VLKWPICYNNDRIIVENFNITVDFSLSEFHQKSKHGSSFFFQFRDGLTKVGPEPKTLPLLLFVRVLLVLQGHW
jgi:hypothetical protein